MSYLLGVAGGSGSGKGTITELIKEHLLSWGVSCFILSTDDCYKDLSYLSREERNQLCFNPDFNFDHPKSIDFERLIAYARNLKKGSSFEYPKYDFTLHSYGEEKIKVPDNLDVAIIEGIYALYSGSEIGHNLLSLYDQRLFVVTTPEIAQNRRILRDIKERGRVLEDVIKQLETTVIPMQKQFVYSTQLNADDIVDWRADESKNIELVKEKLLLIARQKALVIYEAVRDNLLPRLNPEKVVIKGIR